MSDATEDKHEKARELTEEALEHYAKGDQKAGDELASKAVKLDRTAVEEVVEEIDEDLAAQGKTPE